MTAVLELPIEHDCVMLGVAQLCEDCSAITPAPHGRCGHCQSSALLSLVTVLNRKTKGEEDGSAAKSH